jgi:pimeloyl-ACP methyl ester carboxylesterase
MLRRAFSRIESVSVFTPLLAFSILCPGQASDPVPAMQQAVIGERIRLHYVEQGSVAPLVLMRGSLSNGGYWTDQIGPLSEHYRLIAGSRRYNYPIENPTRAGCSAITDADDLASLIGILGPGKMIVLGHCCAAESYPFLALITVDLARLLPDRRNFALPDTGHQMWYENPDESRRDVENFLVKAGVH